MEKSGRARVRRHFVSGRSSGPIQGTGAQGETTRNPSRRYDRPIVQPDCISMEREKKKRRKKEEEESRKEKKISSCLGFHGTRYKVDANDC